MIDEILHQNGIGGELCGNRRGIDGLQIKQGWPVFEFGIESFFSGLSLFMGGFDLIRRSSGLVKCSKAV